MTATTTPVIPINALQRAASDECAELHAAVQRVIDSGWYLLGPETDAFEHEFAEFVGASHCVTVANGTDALELALLAAGVRRGDAVATVANAGTYAAIAISKLGATPLFVDVDPDHLLMTAGTLAAALHRHRGPVRAVVITHLYGQLGELDELLAVAWAYGAEVIEDCAQAAGTTRDGRPAGRFGALGTYSFYPTKNLGALGDGGAVVTDDTALATRLRGLRQYGWQGKYHAVLPGGRNSRMDEIQAAVLRVRLPRLAEGNERRRRILGQYADSLAPGRRFVRTSPDASFNAHLAVLVTPSRDEDRARLTEAGIATDIHYPVPDHHQPVIDLADAPTLATTERAVSQILTVPCSPNYGPTRSIVCAPRSGGCHDERTPLYRGGPGLREPRHPARTCRPPRQDAKRTRR